MIHRLIQMVGCLLSFLLVLQSSGGIVWAHEKNVRPTYQMDVTYQPDQDEVIAHMTLTIPVTSQETMKEAYFHLYPKVFHDWKYGDESKPTKPGNIQVSQVKVNDVVAKQSVQDTILKVPFPKPVSSGEQVKIDMDFQLKLPHGGSRLNTFKHTAFLAQWYPMLAVKDKDGWHVEPYTTIGDPFYSQMSDFEITFRLPQGYRVISSAQDPKLEYRSPITLKQKNVRDFAAVLTKDYQVKRGKAGNVDVNLWYLKEMEDVVKDLHDAAISGMDFYSKKFGAYPYPEVDVVLGETGYGIAGMEYPGLVTSIPKVPTEKGEKPAVNVVVHELAHQWWYGVVGNNQAKEPWLDEGLTTFSEFFYMQKEKKEDERELLKRATQRTNEIYQAVGITSAESLYKYPDSIYALMVYIRPAAMLFDLMDQIGEDKVLEILRKYYEKYRFHIATTKDFIQTANEVANKDLTSFFEKWLYFKE
ncbi:M1 family metallopeptidase [Thermoflavimicrobium daqui]|uniref:Peptidase M1 membrane alanine aminopeptidase domain-containing protein n=1 Tax=Thermoflavimicrobium daqui TaxID=2137476 RepID=A0A364K6F7_9BACL|nr:M1 family metallopeptidase [Thermoflavimicrobium daqui]RAL25885.1 hypothetical protein DL897_07350 [Thermoflavimicrobium daqui]